MVGSETLLDRPQNVQSEADAYAFLERLRWGDDGPTQCPHCGSGKGAWFLKPKNPEGRKSKGGSTTRSQRRVWKCRENSCRRQFSVLTNTVLHATKMPVRAWVGTVIDLCEDPTGVSARDIAQRWSVTEKSAWAMLNRIQDALSTPQVAGAELASNAPLWFELSATQAASIDTHQREREQLAERLENEEQETKRQAAEQVQRDVQRALTRADSLDEPSEPPAADEMVKPMVEPMVKPIAEPQTRASGGVSTAAPSPVVPSPVVPSPGDPAELSVDGLSDGQEQPSRVMGKHTKDTESQVESDVKRVLAEVFGQAAPPSPSSSPKLGRGRGAAGLTGERTAQANPKKKKATELAKEAPTADGVTSLQPVDNSVERPRGSKDPTADVESEGSQQGVASRDPLGGGWLGGPQDGLIDTHAVSQDQRQLRGFGQMAESELGPAWASSGEEFTPKAPQNVTASDDQLPLFDETADQDEWCDGA